MFSLTNGRYFLHTSPTDMRKSFDGLCGIISGKMQEKPMSGDLFIFINKRRNRIKMLRWEHGGFVLFYKRLEKGTFEFPDKRAQGSKLPLDYSELVMIINGILIKNTRRKPRFFPHKPVENYFVNPIYK